VDSQPGSGTTFTLYFPITTEGGTVEPAPPADTRAAGGTETILVVEDEALIREYVYKVLSRRGYSVHAFDDPMRAIAYADVHAAPIDLVLSDVVLPTMSGKTMAIHLTRSHPESKVLFMSGYASDAIVRQGVLDPGTAFVQKPFSADTLPRHVRDVLDRGARDARSRLPALPDLAVGARQR
jgi:two-component system, cell cycle sensor histidine kinase and response regulator CckA